MGEWVQSGHHHHHRVESLAKWKSFGIMARWASVRVILLYLMSVNGDSRPQCYAVSSSLIRARFSHSNSTVHSFFALQLTVTEWWLPSTVTAVFCWPQKNIYQAAAGCAWAQCWRRLTDARIFSQFNGWISSPALFLCERRPLYLSCHILSLSTIFFFVFCAILCSRGAFNGSSNQW